MFAINYTVGPVSLIQLENATSDRLIRKMVVRESITPFFELELMAHGTIPLMSIPTIVLVLPLELS